MGQRIKGQEVSIIIVRGGVLESELTDIRNFNVTLMTEIIQQGYLGETTDRFDEVFKGASFDFEMDNHSQDFITFVQAVIDRARRRTPDIVFNISAVLQFPNGQTPTITLPDCFFGPFPLTIGSRTEYAKLKIEGKVSEPDMQTS